MTIFAETHLFGSVDGYKTLAASAAIRNQDFGPLESMGFGQPSARGAGRLLEDPVILAQPIGRLWMAITRALPGPPDTAGRETIQRLSLIFKHRDYRQLVRSDLRKLLAHPKLWKPDHFSQGRRIALPMADIGREPGVPGDHALRVLQGWNISRREGAMAVFPLGSESAILELLRCLHANDLPLLRWGLRLLSSGALADVATLINDDGLATRKPIVRRSLDDPLEIPTIRRFDGIMKPLPALFGEEPPDDVTDDATMAEDPGGPMRSRGVRISILLGGGSAAIVTALAAWMFLVRREEQPAPPMAMPESPVASMPSAPDLQDSEPSPGAPEIPASRAPDPDPVSPPEDSRPPAEPLPETPIAELPAVRPVVSEPSTRSALWPLEDAIEEILQYSGNRVPDRLDADVAGHFRRHLLAVETMAREEPKILEAISRLEGNESVVDRGIIPNDLQQSLREAAGFFIAIESVPAARTAIRRARDGERVMREAFDPDAGFRRTFGIEDPPSGQARTSERNRWIEGAMDRIDRWSADAADRIRRSLSESLTKAADGICEAGNVDGDRREAHRRFAGEIERILTDFGLELAGLPGPAAMDLPLAMERLRRSQKRYSSEREESVRTESCLLMIEDATRVLRYVDRDFQDLAIACSQALDSFRQLKPPDRLGRQGISVIRDLRDTLARERGAPVEALAEVGLALARIRSDLKPRRNEADPGLESAIRQLDSRIVELRRGCLPVAFRSRRGTASVLEDLSSMELDLKAIAKATPTCLGDRLDTVRQGVIEALDAARRAERLDEAGYRSVFDGIDAELRELDAELRAKAKRP